MIDSARAETSLRRMAIALDGLTALAALGYGRYERETDAYQAALLSEYRAWGRSLLKQLTGADAAEQKRSIAAALPDLRDALEALGQEQLPNAVNAMSAEYVPSPDAYHLIGDAITQNNTDIETRLIPNVGAKLTRGVDEAANLKGVLDSLEPNVGYYAGAFWVLLQRFIGDYAKQAQTTDNVIYACRWVRTHDIHSCRACIEYEGEYDSYDAMLEITRQSVPGYFFNSPLPACWANCRCHLELRVNGEWTRV